MTFDFSSTANLKSGDSTAASVMATFRRFVAVCLRLCLYLFVNLSFVQRSKSDPSL